LGSNGITLSRIESALKDRNPDTIPVDDLTPSAVLVMLHDTKDGIEVLLTMRSNHVKDHKGQVSLPGGMSEPVDDDALATAIRESVEEVGLAPAHLRILGRLDDYKTITGYHVVPFVAVLDTFDGLRPMTEEISEVFSFPIEYLSDPDKLRRMPVEHPDGFAEILFVDYDDYVIWGATARILNGLIELVSNEI